MALRITKTFTDEHKNKRALVEGITPKTILNDIAKKYSKDYELPAFTESMYRGKLLLIKREHPLKSRIETWDEWNR